MAIYAKRRMNGQGQATTHHRFLPIWPLGEFEIEVDEVRSCSVLTRVNVDDERSVGAGLVDVGLVVAVVVVVVRLPPPDALRDIH